jgi:hypothetical protein
MAFAADAAGLWKLNGIPVLSYHAYARFQQSEWNVVYRCHSVECTAHWNEEQGGVIHAQSLTNNHVY